MLIRKLFRFENAHIVRGCSTRRCSHSIHGHSYKIEVLLEAHALDNGQMIYDFGLLKENVHDLIDAFDHTVALWSDDDPDYLTAMRQYSERWVLMPVSPSAEQFSRLFFHLIDTALSLTDMTHGKADVRLHSIMSTHLQQLALLERMAMSTCLKAISAPLPVETAMHSVDVVIAGGRFILSTRPPAPSAKTTISSARNFL